MKNLKQVNRRQFLAGSGVTLALPFLESLLPRSAWAQQTGFQKRFAAMYFPSGMYGGNFYGGREMGAWVPAATGPLNPQSLSPVLNPLASVTQHFSVLSGLDNRPSLVQVAPGEGSHSRACPVFLTCAVKRQWQSIDIDDSVDQIIGSNLPGSKFQSLVLAGSPYNNSDLSGVHRDYCGYISYFNRKIVPKISNPKYAFDTIFSNLTTPRNVAQVDDRTRRKKSVLDFVLGEISSLQPKLARSDKTRLNEYLDEVRKIERDVAAITPPPMPGVCTPPAAPTADLNQNVHEGDTYIRMMNLMVDMTAIAFQCGLTNAASIMLDYEGSETNYERIIDPASYKGIVVRGAAHQGLAHHQFNPERIEMLVALNRFQVGFFKRLIEKLAAMPEGAGSVLDNTFLLYGSGLSDGDVHSYFNLPVLVAGGKNMGFKPGYHHAFGGAPFANVHFTAIKRFGIQNVTKFGDATGVLTQI